MVRRFGGGEKIKANRPTRADWKEGMTQKQFGISDMTLLTKITDEAINQNLDLRWKNGNIYTYIGHVLISVNPFKDLGIYTDDILNSYKGKNLIEVAPHVFAIAEASYHHMNSYKENQCIIISGESGAGKTEAAKRMMHYIAAVSEGKSAAIQETKKMVLATNPLLESFGCAKTLRNNNSSRHGKYLEIQFNPQGEPVGAVITNYLLEKNRVVGQINNERNFHIFYQLTKAASAEYKQQFGLQGPESFLYTSKSNCLDVEGINDVNDFQETLEAMDVIGLNKSEQDSIFKVLAVILWLGNVLFDEDEQGHAVVSDPDVVNFVAYLTQVEYADLNKALTLRILETQHGSRRGSVYEVPLNNNQAISVRDALAKTIYERLFEWIVTRVNVSLQARATVQYTIGVLDIYGFEIFDSNNFEQLCINYVNEKLQQIFIELTLKAEQDEYIKEQIAWNPIKFFDNKVVCDLIEAKRPPGIFAALNDACATAHADPGAADSSFVQRLGFLSSNPHFEARGSQFLIKHYAGEVLYNIAGITDKNKDALLKDLLDLAASSKDEFISKVLFPERIDPDSKRRPPTASDKIKSSCNALVDKLMMCHPSYIRTIKPNDHKSSTEYDDKRVHHQIKYLGLCENIRVRRAGFAYRTVFEKFVERFYLLCPETGYAGDYIWQGDVRRGCVVILKHNHISEDQWQLGTSKLFIKNPETIFALENLRDKYWHNMAIKIQRFWRRNKYNIGYFQLRDYGHQILAGRKERRRFSLISVRAFAGDYLDVQNGTGMGAMIRNAINLSPGEEVVFSMKGTMLVPRAMRSSVSSPRTFLLTNINLHVLIATQNGSLVRMVDEKILPLKCIRSVSVSTLRDDWVILHLDLTPDSSDCVITCVFKTELIARLSQISNGRITVNVTPQIQYKKKGGKPETMKFIKDESVRLDDVYKSHVVRAPSGEPPSSRSRPPLTRKSDGNAHPIASNKKPLTSYPQQQSRNTQTGNRMAPLPPLPKGSTPTPPPVVPRLPKYKAIYPFQSQEGNEVSFQKDDTMEIVQKSDSGWWLARINDGEGWVPSNYLEECVAPRPSPPPPPARSSRIPQRQSQTTYVSPIDNITFNNRMNSVPGVSNSASGIPSWRSALEAKKTVPTTHVENKSPYSSQPATHSSSLQVPSISPVIPAKGGSHISNRPNVTVTPQAPPRSASPAALSLADAIKARRQQPVEEEEDDDEDW